MGCRRAAPGGRAAAGSLSLVQRSVLLFLVAASAASGCELAEVVVAEPVDLVIGEITFALEDDGARGTAVFHRTTGYASDPVPGVALTVQGPGGGVAAFQERPMEACFDSAPPMGLQATCYALPLADALALVRPGARLDVEALLPDGGILVGGTRLPGEFSLLAPGAPPGRECVLPPGTAFDLEWSRATGAWAYLAEAAITGLASALDTLGIEVPTDPVVLLGLSISEEDTSIAFPGGLGVFDRFSDNRGLLLAIQDGLPRGTSAKVVVGALDRNAVNWLRGGSFNPSGEVRIPSLFGDGTGVVGSAVTRSLRIEVEGELEGGPTIAPCFP